MLVDGRRIKGLFGSFGRFGCVVVVSLLAAIPDWARSQSIEAIRQQSTPRLDGRLTESVWLSAQAITNLTQRDPNEGAPAIENTEVRFAYDDDALYVGARMFSSGPRAIRALATRRDREVSSQQIAISPVTYRHRCTVYTLPVTAAGVRLDYYHASDSEGD